MIVLDRKVDGLRRWTAHADSLADLQHWLASTPRTWTTSSSTEPSYGSSWDLGADWQDTLKLAREGWSDGASKLHSAIVAMPPQEYVHKNRFAMSGDRPDVGRYIMGEPLHMIERGRDRSHRPIISLIVGIGGTANVKAQQMMNYGAAIVSIIDALESAGRRVELVARWTSRNIRGSGERLTVSWDVKKPEEHIDLSAVAFSLAHPAAVRRLGFAAYERSTLPTIYGYGATTDGEMVDMVDPAAGAFMVPGLTTEGSACNTPRDAMRFAAANINAAAGETLVEVE